MKQVIAYKTCGGKLFESKIKAERHECHQKYEAEITKAMEKIWQLNIIAADDIMEFLDANVKLVTSYLGLKKDNK